ncbi:MAG: hypothetical protein RO009_03760 [Pseudorhodoplanes sp.]|jgi:hypothetical protein|nr:hypothetical protein [Pseudorhodoplanes sp.]
MTRREVGVRIDGIAALCQMSKEEFLQKLVQAPESGFLPGSRGRLLSERQLRWTYADALAIEVSRQFHDSEAGRQFLDANGIGLYEALKIQMSADAIRKFFATATTVSVRSKTLSDFWVAVMASRNTWGSAPRGSWPVTGFGPGEYWSQIHFCGIIDDVMSEVKEWMLRDEEAYPDSDPARIFMTNISAADRRLRKRAEELGIEIAGYDFEGDDAER